jgi:DNA-binding NarL/FixJ family response regulator
VNAHPERLTVLIADDDLMIREVLREVLEVEADLVVVGSAQDTDEAITLAELHTPMVAVLDVRMPGGGGVRAVEEIRLRSPGTRILAFSAYHDTAAVDAMRQAGVVEYLRKGVPNTEIVDAVRRLARSGDPA